MCQQRVVVLWPCVTAAVSQVLVCSPLAQPVAKPVCLPNRPYLPFPPFNPWSQELYRTLQYCGVFWKKNGPYNLKCRAVLHLAPPAAEDEAGGAAAPNGQAGAGGELTRDHSDDSMGGSMEASPAVAVQQQQGGLAAALAAEDARMAEAAAAVTGAGGGAGEAGSRGWRVTAGLVGAARRRGLQHPGAAPDPSGLTNSTPL